MNEFFHSPRHFSDFSSWRSAGHYSSLVSSILGSSGRIYVVCSEPGMGKKRLLSDIESRARAMGSAVVRRDFSRATSKSCCSRVVKVARDVIKGHAPADRVFVLLGDMVPADESEVIREARAIARMASAGRTVVCTMAPEARQLFDELPDAHLVTTSDLLVLDPVGVSSVEVVSELRRLTRGIPALVDALAAHDTVFADALDVPQEYLDALARLVGELLRTSLTNEEIAIRLAMILLGSGSVDDLSLMAKRTASEIVELIGAGTPFFGIDERTRRFSCLYLGDDTPPSMCLSQLQSVCFNHEEICASCLEWLVDAGRYRRAMWAASLMRDSVAFPILATKVVALFDMGEPALLRSIFENDESRGIAEEIYGEGVWDAFEHVQSAGPERRAASRASGDDSVVGLVRDVRDSLRWVPRLSAFDGECPDHPTERLLVHRQVAGLLSRGRIGSAMGLSSSVAVRGDADSLSEALLAIDGQLVRIMYCDEGWTGDSCEEERLFLETAGFGGSMDYWELLQAARAVALDVPAGPRQVDMSILRAERARNSLSRAFLLTAGSIFDLRNDLTARALVRARMAGETFISLGADYYARVARLLESIAMWKRGEVVEPWAFDSEGDDLGAVEILVQNVLFYDGISARREPLGRGVPQEALWLLFALTEGIEGISQALLDILPLGLLERIEKTRSAWKSRSDVIVPPQIEETLDLVEEREEKVEKPIKIRLLGDFSVTVEGKRIEEGRLDARQMRSTVTFLALQGKASVSRFRMVEQVWPNSDYDSGFHRVYQSVSAFRKVVSKASEGRLDPFVRSKSRGTVGLNWDIVECDVDEFSACALSIFNGDDLAAVVKANRLAELYQGDLCVPPMDATGYVADRRDCLRAQFVDGLVHGAEAAYRQNELQLSVRFACAASIADEDREDAVIAHVRALRACGRDVEARRVYQRFMKRLSRRGKDGPSRELQIVAGLE